MEAVAIYEIPVSLVFNTTVQLNTCEPSPTAFYVSFL